MMVFIGHFIVYYFMLDLDFKGRDHFKVDFSNEVSEKKRVENFMLQYDSNCPFLKVSPEVRSSLMPNIKKNKSIRRLRLNN